MSRTMRNAISAVFVALTIVAASADPAASPTKKPNIIVIFTDDHGFADLGCHGVRADVKTPHLDTLAADGVRFARGYVTAPQCVPSRAGMLTGRYQTRFGVDDNTKGPLPLSETTIAERLRAAGYVTGMVGKWHLDHTEGSGEPPANVPDSGVLRSRGAAGWVIYYHDFLPWHHGFSEYFCGTMRHYRASFDLKGETLPNAPRGITDERYRIDVQTDAALAFLRRRVDRPEQPFFLYLAYFAPHVPLEKPAKYMRRFADVEDETRRMGLAAISAVDDGVGRIRAFLREHRLEENTLIWFIGDNGAPTRPGAWDGSLNEPLVGEKGMLTDGGIRVPFLAAWKGVLPAGKVYDRPVISLDVAATAVKLAGLPADPALDGVDLIPFLTGKRAGQPHEYLFWRWGKQAAALSGNWKLLSSRPGEWKLFNMERMDGERHDLAEQHPDVVSRLKRALEAWAAEQKTPGLPR